MSQFSRFISPFLFTSNYRVLEFVVDDSTFLDLDLNSHRAIVHYVSGSTISQLPASIVLSYESDDVVTLEGEYELYEMHTINNGNYHLRDKDCVNICVALQEQTLGEQPNEGRREYGIYEVNDAVIAVVEPTITPSEFRTLINTSTLLYLENEPSTIANVFFHTISGKTQTITSLSTTRLGTEHRFLVDEVSCISEFAKTLTSTFPEVGFYNIASKRPNKPEVCFYKSNLAQARSDKHNSRVLEHPEFGSYYMTTVPIDLTYETSDIAIGVRRRHEYLTGQFLRNCRTYSFTVDLPSADAFTNETSKTFTYAVYWDRSGIGEEQLKNTAEDGSERKVYQLRFRCDLNIIVYEKKTIYPTIDEYVYDVTGGYLE